MPVRDNAEVLAAFHPAIADWFRRTFPAPTRAQAAAWPSLLAGQSTLVAAPTGSGKTLTAFLAALDDLVRRSLDNPDGSGALPDETAVIYVSPLKALSNDIRLNLSAPLEGIAASLEAMGLPAAPIRTAVRTGDTPARERSAMSKRPPHIVVTTPESLYVLLGSDSGRRMLSTVRSVIVDEIHAVAGGKRGSHLSLSLERLDALCAGPVTRIGLSATQKPIERIARFLVGAAPDCTIVDIGHQRQRDLALEVPPVPLEAVMSNEVWERVYDRLAELVAQHRTTLIFVNTRRMAERAARHLTERLGRDAVAAHHGSLAKEHRLDAEQRLKNGALRVLIATASLELGIDIGDVDLVCQLGSPRGIAAFLQRVGRSGHQVLGTPKGRLFPSSRDDLIECAALLDCVQRGELDSLTIPSAPLDVLAQQIVAEVSCQGWSETALFERLTRAMPYASLPRARFDVVMRMLAEGYTSRHGPRGAYLHRDIVSGMVRGRRGAKLTAVSAGGTIPENADFTVMLEPQAVQIGTVNEDFAVESLAGDVFQLGNASYRILKIEAGRVRVENAQGQPPNIPFWLGEAPGRSDALSAGVARLRGDIDRRLQRVTADAAEDRASAIEAAIAWLHELLQRASAAPAPAPAKAAASRENHRSDAPVVEQHVADLRAPGLLVPDTNRSVSDTAARQIVEYLARAQAALGVLPTQETLVMERFFDESGGTQLVIHTPFGSRINRAWGLALRKRFCRTFNFELQAAATEDAIVLSLSTSHSFALDEVWRYLHSQTAEHTLVQALLDAPLFNVRWRWNATTALALPRFTGGHKVAPQLQRMRSEDLLATVFPDQVACLENIVGERELPNHPLVDQTVDDCLHDAMDTDGWLSVLRRMESGAIKLVARDLPAPSPLAAETLNARPYAFLDDAPLEERRTQAVLNRRWTDPTSADDLGALDAEAIAAVREEAWPRVRSADEMHEALLGLGCMHEAEIDAGPAAVLVRAGGAAPADTTVATDVAVNRDAVDADRNGNDNSDTGASPRTWLRALAKAGRVTRMQVARDDALWVPLERLANFRLIFPQAPINPMLQALALAPGDLAGPIAEEDAILDIVRARLTGTGPVTLSAIARPLTLPASAIALALTRLETEGYIIRGRFTPTATEDEWCERHLLARIHRYTVKRLRREIEPVSTRDFMRFLFEWQHLAPSTRGDGPDALAASIAQLEGFEVAAAGWEEAVLPARLTTYDPAWLDALCRSGRLAWARLSNRAPAASTDNATSTGTPTPVRSTPIVLLPRRSLDLWTSCLPAAANANPHSSRAQAVCDALSHRGALFFDELASDLRLLPMELEAALGELVATGEVSADSFAGLRALIAPVAKRNPWGGRGGGPRGRRYHARFNGGMDDAGRWALLRRDAAHEPAAALDSIRTNAADAARGAGATATARPAAASMPIAETVEHIAMTLLRRYGVVFWRLLAREADWLPPWRDLLRVYHRLEARGDIRGGRFVEGPGGEQFALPEAIPVLRALRKRVRDEHWQVISAVDPLNLVGTLLPGDKVPAIVSNRVLFRDGVPQARLIAGKFSYDASLTADERELARRALTDPRSAASSNSLPVLC